MNNFKISYHNVDLDIIQKNLNDNKKKVSEINKILSYKILEINFLFIDNNFFIHKFFF